MPSEADRVRLQHMLDAARRAVRFAEGRSREDLDDEDDPLRHALVRQIEIVGEAAGKVSSGTRADLPDVPWPDIIGIRNRLIHAYFDVDLDILWATIQRSLPALIQSLESDLGGSAEG